ncbi:long-chain acyl-CoA thioesterase FadM [bacterium BMS3Abin04]|nr:long-chain acyl-CoA thioesterase FadM [bacterium BMS3Abin04]
MYSAFETKIFIRPDDIDMNNHVHYSKYLDYILTARYEQMKNNYKVSMEEFVDRGFAWVASKVEINYKRALLLPDKIFVRAQIGSIKRAQVFLNFWIIKEDKNKVAAEGKMIFTMISTKSGRPVKIPDDIIEKYSV